MKPLRVREAIHTPGVSLDLLDMGGQVQRGQSVNGRGTREVGHRHYGGDLTLKDYIIN